MVATTVTLRPPSRWCSGETPPQGGQLGRGPDENAISQRSTVTVDDSQQDRQELPPGGSLLTQKSTAFPSVLLLQELDEFSTVHSQHHSQQDRQELVF